MAVCRNRPGACRGKCPPPNQSYGSTSVQLPAGVRFLLSASELATHLAPHPGSLIARTGLHIIAVYTVLWHRTCYLTDAHRAADHIRSISCTWILRPQNDTGNKQTNSATEPRETLRVRRQRHGVVCFCWQRFRLC